MKRLIDTIERAIVQNIYSKCSSSWLELNKNKANSGNIPTKTLKTIARDICIPVTTCINSAILNGVFPL